MWKYRRDEMAIFLWDSRNNDAGARLGSRFTDQHK